ncbi:NADH-FMN oxidoreductase RutF, flavin reductase (DIM6/NTAB) family [Candidatus Kryptonium thompsonii]|uniref:NADH-FMN oxidoreductase RutF, flavin reductase (DIM6/NTAB) family n=1 Tax=Candidatus Kryptonium thompsonii TaxID=1633631 RepID=A0A0P1LN02_9BACT|nr:flavin reductase family protein [Candidatus Kryptonium thompsoni]CUS78728.1 NADH-FMN oxidoreductase RutF, flavin reductase (DIM6/NTAB) family [Candidatus Kryptonium thompsoni]CUS83297.1 NADH-FMN oxidoreductase RutF, flavin reductase (DIM6/NTAB) family [Candidatus Kryptonium thompsoni]CUS84191.1 NADH-FMN oxidoreductase RutF, flavin reductase (DIM6/NTAB) family [Candidatus Kryptonium thompsoni]CUS84661.1 NADH-FMN oxidoreductase RutF, flavin reductase (DIM6/NTAB) family [Candidatus Kryptonium t
MNPEAKKKALRMITYGLYILTSKSGDRYSAGTVNWLSQSSFEPPLVMVGVKRDSGLHSTISESGVFAVNILASDQKEIASAFFKPTSVENDKINGYRFEQGETGSPLLVDLPAFFECRVVDKVERGDHTIFVGEVINAGVRKEAKPLVMWDTGWFYGG